MPWRAVLVPPPVVDSKGHPAGIIAYGSSHWAVVEARDQLRQESGIPLDYLLLKALPGDRTHNIKLYGAKEFVLTGSFSLTLGLAYNGRSGAPLSYLSSHPLYGDDEAFVLPRGSAGRTPWLHSIDGHLGGSYRITKDTAVQLSVDIFNMFNFDKMRKKGRAPEAGAPPPPLPQA